MTLQGAVRYEHAWSFFPEGQSGLLADSVFGGKAYTLPEAKGVKGYNDIAPRMGMAYDIFGTGKTAIKVNLAKYWQTASNDGQYQTANPAATFVQTTTRSWVDGNRNFTPDCNLNNRAAQDNRASGGDLCGAWDVANFGSIATATVLNPAVLEGWGIRPYDWQFSASVQQQIMPRVSAEIGYSRRWWGNFFFTDNRAVGPQDFDTMTFKAPTNPNLPNSGQNVWYALLKDSGFGKLDNYSTFASDFGDVDYHWQGVDLTVDARPRNGLTLQGGFTTGAGFRDYCARHRQAAGTADRARHPAAAGFVPHPGVLAVELARPGHLRVPEGRDPGQLDPPVDGEHRADQRSRARTAPRWPATT